MTLVFKISNHVIHRFPIDLLASTANTGAAWIYSFYKNIMRMC